MAKVYQETKTTDYAPLVARAGGVLVPIVSKGDNSTISPLHAPKDKTRTLHYVYKYPNRNTQFTDGEVFIDKRYTYPGWVLTKNTTEKADDSMLDTSYDYRITCNQSVSYSDYTSVVRRLVDSIPMDMPSIEGMSVRNDYEHISDIYSNVVGYEGNGGGTIWADLSGFYGDDRFWCNAYMSFSRNFMIIRFPTVESGATVKVKIRLEMKLSSYVQTAPGTNEDAALPQFPFLIEAYPIVGAWTNDVITPMILGTRTTFNSQFTQATPGEKVVEQFIDVVVPESRTVLIGANLQPGVETIKAAIGAENDYSSIGGQTLQQRYSAYVWLYVYNGGEPVAP